MPRVAYEEEPCSLRELSKQDEWYKVYRAALQTGIDEDTAREIADETMDYSSVGPERYYGVSRDD